MQFDGSHPGNKLYKYQIEKIKKFIDETGESVISEIMNMESPLLDLFMQLKKICLCLSLCRLTNLTQIWMTSG